MALTRGYLKQNVAVVIVVEEQYCAQLNGGHNKHRAEPTGYISSCRMKESFLKGGS